MEKAGTGLDGEGHAFQEDEVCYGQEPMVHHLLVIESSYVEMDPAFISGLAA